MCGLNKLCEAGGSGLGVVLLMFVNFQILFVNCEQIIQNCLDIYVGLDFSEAS